MALLNEIQSDLLDENKNIGPILLKLRLLASRLDTDVLEDWVRSESEGYLPHSELPTYRSIAISYRGTFSGSFGSGVQNAPIPPYLIEQFAGKSWNTFSLRQGMAGIEELLTNAKGGSLQVDRADLILLLQGNVYEDLACNSVKGNISAASLREIQSVVRSKCLELTIKLEKSVPSSSEITITNSSTSVTLSESSRAGQVAHQVIYGNVTNIQTSGAETNIIVGNTAGKLQEFMDVLANQGIPIADVNELGAIVQNEKPTSKEEPFGSAAQEWLLRNLSKAGKGTWKVGMSVATEVIKEATLKYYGLK